MQAPTPPLVMHAAPPVQSVLSAHRVRQFFWPPLAAQVSPISHCAEVWQAEPTARGGSVAPPVPSPPPEPSVDPSPPVVQASRHTPADEPCDTDQQSEPAGHACDALQEGASVGIMSEVLGSTHA